AGDSGAPYKPLPPERLYLSEAQWRARLDEAPLVQLTPFSLPPSNDSGSVIEIDARQGRNFAPERAEAHSNLFDAVTAHVQKLQGDGKRVVIALWTEGSRERISHVLTDHKLVNLVNVASWPEALKRPKPDIALAVLGLESGFEMPDLAVIGEQDIL